MLPHHLLKVALGCYIALLLVASHSSNSNSHLSSSCSQKSICRLCCRLVNALSFCLTLIFTIIAETSPFSCIILSIFYTFFCSPCIFCRAISFDQLIECSFFPKTILLRWEKYEAEFWIFSSFRILEYWSIKFSELKTKD